MNLNLSEEQELFLDATRRFLDTESPLSKIRNSFDQPSGFERSWWQQAAELGWTMLGVPEALGGISLSGNSAQDLAIVAEAMGANVAPGPFHTASLSLYALANCQQAAQFEALLSSAMSGETIIAWAFGEAANNWHSEQFACTLQADADGWVLDGSKAYVEAGADADYLLVTAISAQGPTQIIIPASTSGVTIKRSRSLDFVRRYAQVQFDQVRISEENLLYDNSNASEQIERQLQLALLLQCAESNGAVEQAMNMTMEYMQDRYAFGRAIASFQALKHRLADMALHLHSCMAITDAALKAFDTRAADADELTFIAKSYVGTKSAEIMSDLVQLTGGIALTWEHDLHLFSRRIAVNRAIYGTPETYRYRLQQLLAA